jgi:hypothetical protein
MRVTIAEKPTFNLGPQIVIMQGLVFKKMTPYLANATTLITTVTIAI